MDTSTWWGSDFFTSLPSALTSIPRHSEISLHHIWKMRKPPILTCRLKFAKTSLIIADYLKNVSLFNCTVITFPWKWRRCYWPISTTCSEVLDFTILIRKCCYRWETWERWWWGKKTPGSKSRSTDCSPDWHRSFTSKHTNAFIHSSQHKVRISPRHAWLGMSTSPTPELGIRQCWQG